MGDGLINVNGDNVQVLQVLFLTTMITLVPSLLVMMTSFARYIISFSFLRTAMGTQQTPPNMVLVGLALILTYFTMAPTFSQIKTQAYDPYVAEEISQEEALERMVVPLKEFMLRNTEVNTMETFINLSRTPVQENPQDYPLTVVVPAFMTSELKAGFTAGFLIYLPFLLVDIIVSTTLMSMGMVMLPPAMISMPFKLLLFVTVDGWELLFSSIVQSFR